MSQSESDWRDLQPLGQNRTAVVLRIVGLLQPVREERGNSTHRGRCPDATVDVVNRANFAFPHLSIALIQTVCTVNERVKYSLLYSSPFCILSAI